MTREAAKKIRAVIVDDEELARQVLREFLGAHPGNYLVDTKFTDNFGRNATCAADSIFARVDPGKVMLSANPPE